MSLINNSQRKYICHLPFSKECRCSVNLYFVRKKKLNKLLRIISTVTKIFVFLSFLFKEIKQKQGVQKKIKRGSRCKKCRTALKMMMITMNDNVSLRFVQLNVGRNIIAVCTPLLLSFFISCIPFFFVTLLLVHFFFFVRSVLKNPVIFFKVVDWG